MDWTLINARIERVGGALRRTYILLALFMGAITPVFRGELLGKTIGVVSVAILTVIAGMHLFRSRAEGGEQPPH